MGGITFALDLSQAFDTVSRQDILDQLQALSVEPSLVSLVHGLHHSSKYRLHAQGGYTEVETTTGIKQGCKLAPTLFSVLTGRLLHMLIDTFGLDAVTSDRLCRRHISSQDHPIPARPEACARLDPSLVGGRRASSPASESSQMLDHGATFWH